MGNQHAGISARDLATRSEFRALITRAKANGGDLSDEAIARALKPRIATTAATARRARIIVSESGEVPAPPAPTIADVIAEDRAARRSRIDAGEYKKRYEYTADQLEQTENALAVALALQATPDILKIERNPSLDKNEGCAMLLWSDWHIEERVDKRRVNGHNEYNPDIATARAKKLVANSLAMTKLARQDIHVDTCVLWLGGDFINGYIHDELEETNFMSPTEATLFAFQLLISGIQHLVDHGKFKRIVVPCNFGNHGRTTHKKRISSGYKNSYEWMLYWMLQRHFKGCDIIEFNIPESSYTYTEIFGRVIRTFHGDEIGYGGGIGGVTIPLIKKIHRLNTQRYADMNVIGHFHSLCYPSRDITMNGCLVGFSPYAEWLGCTPEPPMQGFRLLDAKRGFTLTTPVFCE